MGSEDADTEELRLVGRKLVLFAGLKGAIVWMGESVSGLDGPLARTEAVSFSLIEGVRSEDRVRRALSLLVPREALVHCLT